MKIKCENCGAQMIDQSKGPYIHFVCPNCGHALATYDYTKEELIKIDRTIYSIKSIDNKTSPEFIKIISKANSKNYLECKKIIENNEIIFSGKADEIIALLDELKSLHIKIEILPKFPYKI